MKNRNRIRNGIDLIHIYIIDDYIDKDGNICALLMIKMDYFRDAKNTFLAQFSLIGCRTYITACECIQIEKISTHLWLSSINVRLLDIFCVYEEGPPPPA